MYFFVFIFSFVLKKVDSKVQKVKNYMYRFIKNV